ncbi:hypothetical protein ES319_D06G043000v1 [Gossypium barbadense]|uniref:F-box domain-containing protein n=2 Tax=Gossypium TaxID=3633 RepID=A0A5J5R0E1_GOSBA|nr:hypothetical protein ES319_D06G043000v1 [Gossypium barbadense]TYG63633.1 hypothetical protein ES288_D06G045800v1 [Gossypium darwinii]
MDGFDQLPDSLILLIFNSVSDVKSLIRCRSVSKRFNSLVPQTDSILLKIDRVISSESDSDSLFLTLLKSFFNFILPKPTQSPLPNRTHTYPAQILSRFQRIRELHVELPAGDLQLEKGTVVKWRAEFGETLKTCVIFGFRLGHDGNYETEFAGGLKRRVMWTISALMAASVRHFLLREVVREHKGMEELVITDREGEGEVVMEEQGLREWREARESHVRVEEEEEERGRTVVPSVRMRMRHEPRLGATLVVVRAVKDGTHNGREADVEDADLAVRAFGNGVYGDAVRELLKARSYLLEMNSF